MLLETADSHAPANLHSVLVAILFRDVPLNAERKIIEFRLVTTSVLDRHASMQRNLVRGSPTWRFLCMPRAAQEVTGATPENPV